MNISQRIEELSDAKHKLLLIIGQPGSGKSKMIRHYSEETGNSIGDLDKIFINTQANNSCMK